MFLLSWNIVKVCVFVYLYSHRGEGFYERTARMNINHKQRNGIKYRFTKEATLDLLLTDECQ